MTNRTFVNREDELETLRSRYDREQAEFIVVYGRRRLGKSALVRESIRDRSDAIYWQATEETPEVQIADFVETAGEVYPHLTDVKRDWEAVLRTLGREDAIVVLDEFPYLIQSDDSLPSKIQRVWDTSLEETEMTLVLVGSSISVMEEKVLDGGSPLYGRRTLAIDLPPLDIGHAAALYPTADPETLLESWGVFGGTPYYLRAIDQSKSLAENIQSLLLSEYGVLHTEPEFLLRTEFGIREPQTYYAILRAIASGKREVNEISGFTGVDSNSLGTYLAKLRRLRLLERDIPVTANPNTTRTSRYRLSEPLFRFWFRFVYGQEQKLIQLGDDAYEQLIEPQFSDYMGTMFEVVCQRALPNLHPKLYQGVGYWWYKEQEIDVVGLADDGTLVVGECKYTSRQMTEGNLARLEQKADEIRWTPPNGGNPTYHYCCFSRSGFSTDLEQVADTRDDVSLFSPEDIVASFDSATPR